MAVLNVQCDHCEYWDAGYDHDLIMIELRRHEQNCTAQRGGFIFAQKRGHMKHNFSIRDIVGALKTVRGVKNYYSDAQLAHLVDEAREVNAILDALPEPVADEWEECAFSDIRKGDRVKVIETTSVSDTVTTLEATAHHQGRGAWLDKNSDLIACWPLGTYSQLFRIPAPVQHPDPEQHPVIMGVVTRDGSNHDFGVRNWSNYHVYSDGRSEGFLNSDQITDWEPAKIVRIEEK